MSIIRYGGGEKPQSPHVHNCEQAQHKQVERSEPLQYPHRPTGGENTISGDPDSDASGDPGRHQFKPQQRHDVIPQWHRWCRSLAYCSSENPHGKGRNAQGEPWRIGIEQPNIVQGGNTQIVVPLDNRSLATSGDYRIFHVDPQGRRLSHIIDPKTRRPLSHSLASISVVADNATTADGLSTGLFVLGETEALKLAEQQNLAVFLIIREQNGYRTEMSGAFKKLLH